MADRSSDRTSSRLSALDSSLATYATQFIDMLLTDGREFGASDVHLTPAPGGIEARMRIDGVLQSLGTFPQGKTADVIAQAQGPRRSFDISH